MSRIFTIGTRRRSTKTLLQQAKRAIEAAKSQPVVQLHDTIALIVEGDYSTAYTDLQFVKANVNAANQYLGYAIDDMNNNDYTSAVNHINQALQYLQ